MQGHFGKTAGAIAAHLGPGNVRHTDRVPQHQVLPDQGTILQTPRSNISVQK